MRMAVVSESDNNRSVTTVPTVKTDGPTIKHRGRGHFKVNNSDN